MTTCKNAYSIYVNKEKAKIKNMHTVIYQKIFLEEYSDTKSGYLQGRELGSRDAKNRGRLFTTFNFTLYARIIYASNKDKINKMYHIAFGL